MKERKSRVLLIVCLMLASVLATVQGASAMPEAPSEVGDCVTEIFTVHNQSAEEPYADSEIEIMGPVFCESQTSSADMNDTIMATYTFSVGGNITYTDRRGWTMPLRLANLTIWDYTYGWPDSQIGGVYQTDKDGNFQTGTLTSADTNGPDLYIKVYSEGDAAIVRSDGGNIYSVSTVNDPVNNWQSGNCIINLDITQAANENEIGAFRAHDAAVEGYIWVTEDVFLLGDVIPPKVVIIWPTTDGSPPCYFPDFFPKNNRRIHLKDEDPDYPDKVIHEYGHYIMDFYYDWPDWGTTNLDYGRTICDCDNTMIAWMEGWAYYFAARANKNLIDGNDARYTYGHSLDDNPLYYDFENRTTTNPDPLEKNATLPENGSDVIMCVAAFLVDLVDGDNEGLEQSTYTDDWIHHVLRDEQFEDISGSPPQKTITDFWTDWKIRHDLFWPSSTHFPKTALFHNEFFILAENIPPVCTLETLPFWVSGVVNILVNIDEDTNAEDISYQTIDLQYSMDGCQSWIDLAVGIPGGLERPCEINRFTNGINAANVYIRVRTFDDMEYSAWYYSNLFNIDNLVPGTPAITSTHTEGEWSNNNNPIFNWSEISDVSGITYYYDWNNNPTSIPTSASQSTQEFTASFSNTPDGTWYLHVRAMDGAGNWGGTDHYGPIFLDILPPSSLTVSSSTHTVNVWSNKVNPSFSWTDASGSGSSIQYFYKLDQTFNTNPDSNSLSTISKSASIMYVSDGQWYFHVIPQDSAGNWGITSHYGPILIDFTPPVPPAVSSSTHPNTGSWYTSNDVIVQWVPPNSASPIIGYSLCLDRSPTTVPDTVLDPEGTTRTYNNLADGIWYFHVRAQDYAGNWGETAHYGPIRIDVPPNKPNQPRETWVGGTAEKDYVNSNGTGYTRYTVHWDSPIEPCGLGGYELWEYSTNTDLWKNISTDENNWANSFDVVKSEVDAPEGTQYFYRVRARSSSVTGCSPVGYRWACTGTGLQGRLFNLEKSYIPG